MTTNIDPHSLRTGPREFIFLMAVMAALDAFSIDGMLPALDQMSADLDVLVTNHRQRVVTALFLGFSAGVLIYGFLADRFGRRWPTIVGYVIFCMGSLLCMLTESFDTLITGRVLQGFGAAGPYVLSTAIVRDLYQGRQMAKRLSLIMMVFIGVPMIAPFVGQGVLLVAGWRSIFLVLMLFAIGSMVWFWIRQIETLKPEYRQSIAITDIRNSVVEVLTHRETLSYLLSLGLVLGAFIVYLSTGQQVFQKMYALGDKFPIVFASLASLFGIASYFNSRWVEQIGSAKLIHLALTAIVLSSILFLWIYRHGLLPSLWAYLIYLSIVMVGYAFLFGNMTSLALSPMGQIAGAASSLVNSLSTLLAIVLATFIGGQLTDNVLPVAAGFGVLCGVAWLVNYSRMKKSAERPIESSHTDY